MDQFNVGDVVVLRSGGPQMTIAKVWEGVGRTYANVIYFTNTQESGSAQEIPIDCLRLATKRPEAPAESEKMRHTSVAKSSL